MEYSEWQTYANSLLNYKLVYVNNNISAIPFRVSFSQIDKWVKDILHIINLARVISLKNRNHVLKPREDWRKVAELYLSKPRYEPIVRPDCIIKDNKLKILELNIDSALGGLFEIQKIQSLMKINPLYKNTSLNVFPAPKQAVINYFIEMNKLLGVKNIAVLGSKNTEPWNIPKVKEFCNWINCAKNINAYYRHPEQIIFNKNSISIKGHKHTIDSIYRYRVLLHPKEQVEEFIDLLEKAYSSSVIMLSDPADLFIEHKGIIALLSEAAETDQLSKEEKEIIKNFIPWTRFLSSPKVLYKQEVFNTKEFCLHNRELLVLKRMFSHHGNFVYIGSSVTEERWNELLTNALKNAHQWIIQEAIDSDYYEFACFSQKKPNKIIPIQRKSVISPVLFGKYFGGALVRLLPECDSTPSSCEPGLAGIEVIQQFQIWHR